MNHDIVRGKFNKSLKPQNPSKPWSPKDFFGNSGYYVHNTQGYLAKPDSLAVPSRPPPAERTAEDQPFFSSPVGSLCHTHGVVLRPSFDVCRLCPPLTTRNN